MALKKQLPLKTLSSCRSHGIYVCVFAFAAVTWKILGRWSGREYDCRIVTAICAKSTPHLTKYISCASLLQRVCYSHGVERTMLLAGQSRWLLKTATVKSAPTDQLIQSLVRFLVCNAQLWRGEHYAAGRSEYMAVKNQLQSEAHPPQFEGEPAR